MTLETRPFEADPEDENTTDERPTVRNRYSRTVIQPLLITLMATSLVTTMLTVLQIGADEWPWMWIVVPCIVVCLEGIYTTMWLHQPEQRGFNRGLYRAAEIFVIVLMTRLLAWALTGSWPTSADWYSYLREPLLILWDFFFLFSLFIILLVWERATFMGYVFHYMAIDEAERAFYQRPTHRRRGYERPIASQRSELITVYGRNWIWGGTILTFMAMLSTVEYPTIVNQGLTNVTRLGMRPETLLALLVYFGAGFALLSQARLALMNARWLIGGVRKTAAIERSWSRNTLFILLIVGGIAAFLPLGSTTLIGRLLEIIISFVVWLVSFIVFLFFTILLWLYPAGEYEAPLTEEAPPPFSPFAQNEAVPPSPPGFPIFGLLFWIVAVVVSVAAIMFFLRERNIKINSAGFNKIWARLRSWWRTLWLGVRMQVVDLRDALVVRLVRDTEEEGAQPPWRFIRLSALNPRQKLRYFYLSTVRRAEERGVGRQESETPIEYADDLKGGWPATEPDVDVLTAAFLRARYSNRTITEEDVRPVQEHWKHIRAELKRRSQASQTEEHKNERSDS